MATPRWLQVLNLAEQAGMRGITSDDIAEHLGISTGSASVTLKRLRCETPETYDMPVLLTRTPETRQSRTGYRCSVHRITNAGIVALAANWQKLNQPDNPTQKEE